MLILFKSGFSNFVTNETDTEELSPRLLTFAWDLSCQHGNFLPYIIFVPFYFGPLETMNKVKIEYLIF